MKKAKVFVIIVFLALTQNLWAAEVFLEPYVGIGQMVLALHDQNQQDYDIKDIANGFMVGCKGGLNLNRRLFAGLDYQTAGPFTFGRTMSKAEMTVSMLGIGAGLDYDLSRFWAGYYFNQTIRDSVNSITYTGEAAKIGFGLKVTKNLHANIELIFHNIYSRDTSTASSFNLNRSLRAQSAFASVSLPVDFR
jgi:predicted porin